jgi:hypothetical protein
MVAGVAAAAVCCLAGTLLLAVGGGVVAHGVVRVLIDGAFTSGFDEATWLLGSGLAGRHHRRLGRCPHVRATQSHRGSGRQPQEP